MRFIFALSLAILSFATPVTAEDLAFFEKNLGKAPTGFSWYLCHKGFLAIRRPNGWFVREDGPSQNGTMACFVTKEQINSQTKEFKTGFSINILPRFFERHGEHPSQYAKRFVGGIVRKTRQSGGSVGEVFETGNGPMKGIAVRYSELLEGKSGVKDTTIHQFLIANDQTSTLYISAFESPTSEWKEAWKIGDKIVQQLGILSNK